MRWLGRFGTGRSENLRRRLKAGERPFFLGKMTAQTPFFHHFPQEILRKEGAFSSDLKSGGFESAEQENLLKKVDLSESFE